MSCEGLNDDEELKTVPIIKENSKNSNVVSNSDSDNVNNNESKNVFDKDIDNEVKATHKTTIEAKVVWMMKSYKLHTMMMPKKSSSKLHKSKIPSKILIFLIDLTMVPNDIIPTIEEPQMFKEDWNHPNKDSHRKWQDAICKEFANMNKQQFSWKMLKSLLSPN